MADNLDALLRELNGDPPAVPFDQLRKLVKQLPCKLRPKALRIEERMVAYAGERCATFDTAASRAKRGAVRRRRQALPFVSGQARVDSGHGRTGTAVAHDQQTHDPAGFCTGTRHQRHVHVVVDEKRAIKFRRQHIFPSRVYVEGSKLHAGAFFHAFTEVNALPDWAPAEVHMILLAIKGDKQ